MNADVLTQWPQRLLRDGMLANAGRFPDKEAIVVEGKPYTYRQLSSSARSLAAALKTRGVNRGDRVAIYMDNTWPCVVSIYGILLAGGIFLVINPQTKAGKLEFILKDSDATLLLTDGHLANIFTTVLADLDKLCGTIASGPLPDAQSKMPIESFDEIIETTDPLPQPIDVIPNDLAALLYTSGSTGFPKGVMQTHQSMVFAAGSLIEYQRLNEEHRILLVLPLASDYGLYQLLMAMNLGATLIVERSFTFPAQIYQRLENQKASVFPGIPTIFAMMISSHKKKALCFPTITRATNTAAALPANFVPYLHEIFPNALIYKMYGLTECKRATYLEPELVDKRPTSVGKAIPGTEVYLLSKGGEHVPTGEIGILYVRGPHVMSGYWKRPDLSEEMLKQGGLPGERVLCTQDWFRMDEEGFLYFVGRNDDIIKTRGEKVSPIEVENVLYKLQGVKEAAVIGVADDIFGQSIKAVLALDDHCGLNAKTIKKHCSSQLENFMVPKYIEIVTTMPKTTNGKIDKKLLG